MKRAILLLGAALAAAALPPPAAAAERAPPPPPEPVVPPVPVMPFEPPQPDPVPVTDPGRPLRVAGVVGMAVGLAALGAGLWLTHEADDRGDKRPWIAYATSGALIIGGAALYLVGRAAPPGEPVFSLAPTFGAGRAGAVARVIF